MVYFLCKAYDSDRQNCYFALSLPVRGAWIEMCHGQSGNDVHRWSLPVRGAWIEMTKTPTQKDVEGRRSPCGERGLKSVLPAPAESRHASLPVRGAWIEIARMRSASARAASLPVRGAWIEIPCALNPKWKESSLPVRGAWIEISFCPRVLRGGCSRSPCGERGLKLLLRGSIIMCYNVAPRAGSVD